MLLDSGSGKHDVGAVVGLGVEGGIDVDQVDLAAHGGVVIIARKKGGHGKQVVSVDQAVVDISRRHGVTTAPPQILFVE